MRAPPITIACDCGEMKHVPYGEAWICEGCGRRWNTAQIPAEEYQGLLRDMRRMRVVPIAVAVGTTAVFGLLALLVAESLFFFLPIVLGMWFLWYMPWWRRRIRARARSAPKWNMRPE
jgi:hypothetical protein